MGGSAERGGNVGGGEIDAEEMTGYNSITINNSIPNKNPMSISNGIIDEHMRGRIGLKEFIRMYIRIGDVKDAKIGGYVLFRSLEMVEDEFLLHFEVLKRCFRKEYVPGVVSKYVKIITEKGNAAVKEKALELVVYVIERLEKLEEVQELEERMILMVKSIGSELREKEQYMRLLEALMRRSSKEGRVYFVEEILKEGGCPKGEEQSVRDVVEKIEGKSVKHILEQTRTVDAVQKLYGAEYISKIVRKIVLYIRTNSAEHRESAVQWVKNRRTIEKKRKEADNSCSAHTDHKTDRPSVYKQIEKPGCPYGEDDEDNEGEEVIGEKRSGVLFDLNNRTETDVDVDMNELSVRTRADSEASNEKKAAEVLERVVLERHTETAVTEWISSISGKDALLFFEICDDFKIAPRTELSRKAVLKIFEVTGNRACLSKHRVSSIIDIGEELKHRYDFYLGLVFGHRTPLAVSINIIDALLEYSYSGRCVDIAIELGKILKGLEYGSRHERFKLKRETHDIGHVCSVLVRMVDRTHIKKSDLTRILSSIVYLASSDNEQVVEGVCDVLQSVIRSYSELDRGVHRSKYGLAKLHSDVDTPAKKLLENKLSGENSLDREEQDNKTQNGEKAKRKSFSNSDNDENNTMTVCHRIFTQLESQNFPNTSRAGILSLLRTMIECTGDFMVERIVKESLPHILSHYSKKSCLTQNRETTSLGNLLLVLALHPIEPSVYIGCVELVLMMHASRIERSEEIIERLYRRGKEAFMYTVRMLTDEGDRPFFRCSRYTLGYLKTLYIQQ